MHHDPGVPGRVLVLPGHAGVEPELGLVPLELSLAGYRVAPGLVRSLPVVVRLRSGRGRLEGVNDRSLLPDDLYEPSRGLLVIRRDLAVNARTLVELPHADHK